MRSWDLYQGVIMNKLKEAAQRMVDAFAPHADMCRPCTIEWQNLKEALKQQQVNLNNEVLLQHPREDVEWQKQQMEHAQQLNAEAEKQEQDEPVAYINVEQRKLEWAKYTSWETPTVVNLPKIPLYTHSKEWVELTKQEYDDIYENNKYNLYDAMMAVASYLKRKNT